MAMDLDWIDSQFNEMVFLTETWANINSHSFNFSGIENLLHKIQETFARLKPDKTSILPLENHSALLMKKRAEAPFQVYLGGHIDTVYPLESSFQKVTLLEEQTLQGPGVTDMKGGLVVLLKVLEALEKSENKEAIGWQVLINSDEEIGSPYSGPLIAEMGKTCDLALIFEPCLPDGSLVSARKGSANYKVSAVGVAAHVGRNPHEGVNAIHALIQFIHEIQVLQKEGIVNVGFIKGGSSFNVVPAHAECYINLRSYNMDKMNNQIVLIAQKHKVHLDRMTYRPPKPLDPDTEKTLHLFKACCSKIGIDVKWRETGGVCDGNILAESGAIALDSLGVLGKNIHTEEESIYLPSLTEKAKQTAYFLNAIASEEISIPRKRKR